MFTNYIRSELGYKTDMYYYPSGGIQPWDYGVQNGFGDTTAHAAQRHGQESLHEGDGGGRLLRPGDALSTPWSTPSTTWA